MTIGEIVGKQRAFYLSGKTLDLSFRLDALRRLRSAIIKHNDDINLALRSDLRKSDFETYMTETGMVLEEIGFVMKHLRRWAKVRRVRTPLSQFRSKSYVVPEPYGVTLIMSPWNYPLQLCLEPLIGAVAAGNTAVVKPSAYAPSTSALLSILISEVFDSAHVCVVQGGREQNTALLEQKFDYIFFTGSVEVGKLVMSKAAEHLTPVSLELGGKSPVIVDRTANLELAARRIAFDKFLNAGQTCVAPDYVLIEKGLKESFIAQLKKVLLQFFPGADYSDMPVIINDRHFARVSSLIEKSKVVIGGQSDNFTRFIEPTVMEDITFDSPVMREEIFGPVLPLIEYDDLDWAIDRIRSRPRPLALYLFTNDEAVRKRVLSSIPFGGGCVNDTIIHLATPYMGFGGVGESGMGSYHGKHSFDTFTHYKSIVDKANWIDLSMRYHPYSESKLRIIKRFMK